MNEELDKLVPSYQTARGTAHEFFGARSASESGRNFVHRNFNDLKARKHFSSMNAADRELFADSFAGELIDSVRNTRNRVNVIDKAFLSSPAARDRIRLALGPVRARQIEAHLRIEDMMDQLRGATRGQSTTAKQLADMAVAGTAGGAAAYFGPTPLQGDYSSTGIVTALAALGRRKVNQKVAQRVAQILTSTDPQVLQKGVKAAARNERWLDGIRSLHASLAANRAITPAVRKPLQVYLTAGERDKQAAEKQNRGY
jgi:hypothetical protein